MVNFYNQVGYSGIAILLLGLVAIFMAIRGTVLVFLLNKQAQHPQSIYNNIIKATLQVEQAEKDKSTSNANRELVINTLMQVQMKGVYSSMYFLKLCAAISPLLGLLGTVLGMVDVFATLSNRSMPDPSLLAGGIWQALLTTVMGLTLAIPALVIHYFLLMNLRSTRNRITLLVNNINLDKTE